jgi:hypothetical protein
MRNLLFIGGAVAAYFLFKGGNYLYNATRLQFYIGKVGFKLDGLNPTIVIDVYAQNPTASDYQLNSLVGQLIFNGTQVGNISYYTPLTIAPNAQTKIIIPVRVSLLGAGSQLVGIFTGGTKLSNMDLQIAGTVNVNNIPAPVNLTFSIV